MRHQPWPPSFRQRTSAMLMVALAATVYRRWLSRPWQWTLRDYLVVVAVTAAGLLLSGAPKPTIVFFAILVGSIHACLGMARHGFTLVDITTLMALILITAALILPAMERQRNRTLGKSFSPLAVPTRYIHLFSGPG